MAGLIAAVRALDAGARVTVLDKAPKPGGTMAMSSGYVGTYASTDAIIEGVPGGNSALQELVVERLADSLDCLSDVVAPRRSRGTGRHARTDRVVASNHKPSRTRWSRPSARVAGSYIWIRPLSPYRSTTGDVLMAPSAGVRRTTATT